MKEWHTIQVKKTGKFLQANAMGKDDNGGKPNQQWKLDPVEDETGCFKIRSKKKDSNPLGYKGYQASFWLPR